MEMKYVCSIIHLWM